MYCRNPDRAFFSFFLKFLAAHRSISDPVAHVPKIILIVAELVNLQVIDGTNVLSPE